MYEIIKIEEGSAKSPSGVIIPKLLKGEKIEIGGRDTYLFKQVSGLENTFSKEEVLKRALKINEEQFSEPLNEEEIIRIVDWTWEKYGRERNKDMGMKQ